MKTIGLIGGMSWESTVSYYQVINEKVKQALGGLHSAKILLYSVDFAEIEDCQARGDWDQSAEILSDVAMRLEAAGADFIVICTNTMHKVAPQVAEKIRIPILHIAQVTADAIKAQGIKKVALLGTKYTMTQDFYKQKLIDNGIEVLTPDPEGIEVVNDTIYHELCLGKINPVSKQKYLAIIKTLKDQGAEGVILGCTEVGLLIQQEDTDLYVFDTARLHAEQAALTAIHGGKTYTNQNGSAFLP